MSNNAATLLAEALKLSAEERENLAMDILDSLEEPLSDYASMSEEEFTRELQRRSQELLEHPEMGIPWEQVKGMR